MPICPAHGTIHLCTAEQINNKINKLVYMITQKGIPYIKLVLIYVE